MIARSSRNWRSALPALAVFALVTLLAIPMLTSGPTAGASPAQRPLQQEPQDVCGTIVTHTVWSAAIGRYHASCAVRVPDGLELTVEPGVEVAFAEGANLSVDGTLRITGASPTDVVFTSDKPQTARGDWPGVVINPDAVASITGLTIRYAGRGTNPALQLRTQGVTLDQVVVEDAQAEGLRIDAVSADIRNTRVERCGQHAIRTRHNPDIKSIVRLENVTLQDNDGDAVRSDVNVQIEQSGITARSNKTNGIVVQSGILNHPMTWQGDELPLVPEGTVTVNEGITITAGTAIKADSNGSMTIRGGALRVSGTADRPVVFTAKSDDTACTTANVDCDTNNDSSATNPDRGSWRYIDVVGATLPSTVSHTVFRYGTGPVLWVRSPNVTVTDSVFSQSRDHGAKVENVDAVFRNCEFVGSQNPDRHDAAGLLLDNTTKDSIVVELVDNSFADNDYAVFVKNPNIDLRNSGNTTDFTNRVNGYRITGRMTTPQTWRTGDLPFIVSSRLELGETAAVLVLEPGLTVKMEQGALIEAVRGLLRSGAEGGARVLITSVADDACSAEVDSGCDTNGDGSLRQPAPGDWGAVVIRGSGGFIHRSVLRYGGTSSSNSLLDLQSTENTVVQDSEFWYSSNAGIRVFQVNSTLTRNMLAQNTGAGIKLVAGSAAVVVTLDENEFDGNGGCAVDMEANVELVLEGDNVATDNARNGLCVSGDSRVSRTWKKGSLPYLVTGDVSVVGESRLTIEPGAVVKFIGQAGISVSDRSSLSAVGTAGDPIIFTSLYDDLNGGDANPREGPKEPNAGDWNGLKFESTASQREASQLAHARILYAGRQNQAAVQTSLGNLKLEHLDIRDGAAVGLRVDNVSPTIADNNIVNQRSFGIEIRTRTEPLQPILQRNTIRGCGGAIGIDANVEPQLTGNVAEDNMLNGIAVKGSMTVSRVWQAGDLPFLLDSRVLIGRGGTLNIAAGTVVKALADAALSIDFGAIQIPAPGTGDDMVTITSIRDDTCGAAAGTCDTNNDETQTRPLPGDWEGIVVASTARAASFSGLHLSYGGSHTANMLLKKEGVTIQDSLIAHSYSDGLYIDDASVIVRRNIFHRNVDNGLYLRNAASVTIDGNVFTQNGRSIEHRATGNTVTSNNVAIGNTEDGMLFCAPVSTTQTWTNDLMRDVACTIKVSGATLTLDPGLVLRFTDQVGMDVSSKLQAEGVMFTSISDSGDYGLWRGLKFETNSTGGHIRHSRFLYGGYGQQGTIDSQSQGALDVSFSIFRRIEKIAVSARKQSPVTVHGNLFRDLGGNGGGAVRASDRGTNPVVQYNRIVSADTGVRSDADASPVIHGNSFEGSTNGVINADLDVCVDATQNWWGSLTGPTDRTIATNDACRLRDNPGGAGVVASDHVNYTDWLREAPPLVPMVHGPRCGVTSNRSQEANGETSPGAMVHVYDGAAPDPTVPLASELADDQGAFRIALNLSNGPHKLSFEAVKDNKRSAVSGFRVLEVVDSPVDPMGIRFEYGTGGTRRLQPLRDQSGCATACGFQTSGRVTLPIGVPVRVMAPVEGSPASVEFVQEGQPVRSMQYDGVTRAYVSVPFEPVQGLFSIRVAGGQTTTCSGFVYLGGQGVVYEDQGASGSSPLTPAGDEFDFDFESGPLGWTASSPWALVDTDSHSPSHAWHDSPNGNYAPGSKLELRAPGPIDLRTVSSPVLRFWHKYRFARGDRGTLEYRLSATGSWVALEQYNGTIGSWRGDVISLDEFADEPTFYLQFVTHSDNNLEDDGWYVDDVAIVPGGALNERYDVGEPVVEGAQVRLEQLNLDTGAWSRWDGTPSGQLNPQTTDELGRYEFYYLEPGEYQVVVQAGGEGGVYRSASQIVWDGALAIDAPLQRTKPAYLPAVLKRRPLSD